MAPHFELPCGRWVEPFFGSGAVAFGLLPERALVADSNPHIIGFFAQLQSGQLEPVAVDRHLRRQARLLEADGADLYRRVRERFNDLGDPCDFLFLNHASFNGLVRFNRSGAFNTPFCHNPQKFTPSLLDSLHARVEAVALALRERKWELRVADWRETLVAVEPGDFVYLDPPYCGRHTGYFNQWSEDDAGQLATELHALAAPWALSDWLSDSRGVNPLLPRLYPDCDVVALSHRYVVGARASSRGKLTEALVLPRARARPGAV